MQKSLSIHHAKFENSEIFWRNPLQTYESMIAFYLLVFPAFQKFVTSGTGPHDITVSHLLNSILSTNQRHRLLRFTKCFKALYHQSGPL